jgi:nucleotide-binding universal stress UspA family protein
VVTSRISGGRPADVLVAVERETPSDAIVVGSRGLGPIDALLLGSTGVEVLVRSRSTVLVARRETLRRVVLAVDGSTASRRAERLVAAWPLFTDAEILVVAAHRSDDLGAAAVRRLAGESARRLERAGRRVALATPEGDPAGAILAEAAAFAADLVALGARGAGGPSRTGIGTVARNVATAGPSVLVVRRAPAGDD